MQSEGDKTSPTPLLLLLFNMQHGLIHENGALFGISLNFTKIKVRQPKTLHLEQFQGSGNTLDGS